MCFCAVMIRRILIQVQEHFDYHNISCIYFAWSQVLGEKASTTWYIVIIQWLLYWLGFFSMNLGSSKMNTWYIMIVKVPCTWVKIQCIVFAPNTLMFTIIGLWHDRPTLGLQKIHIDKNAAYMLTNVVTPEKLELCKDTLGMDMVIPRCSWRGELLVQLHSATTKRTWCIWLIQCLKLRFNYIYLWL